MLDNLRDAGLYARLAVLLYTLWVLWRARRRRSTGNPDDPFLPVATASLNAGMTVCVLWATQHALLIWDEWWRPAPGTQNSMSIFFTTLTGAVVVLVCALFIGIARAVRAEPSQPT